MGDGVNFWGESSGGPRTPTFYTGYTLVSFLRLWDPLLRQVTSVPQGPTSALPPPGRAQGTDVPLSPSIKTCPRTALLTQMSHCPWFANLP